MYYSLGKSNLGYNALRSLIVLYMYRRFIAARAAHPGMRAVKVNLPARGSRSRERALLSACPDPLTAGVL